MRGEQLCAFVNSLKESENPTADFLNTLQITGENALAVMGVMDKKEKVPAEVFAEMLKEIDVNDEQPSNK